MTKSAYKKSPKPPARQPALRRNSPATPSNRILTVSQADENTRLDHFLRHELAHLSRGSIERLLEQGKIRIAAQVAHKGTRLRAGQKIIVDAEVTSPTVLPQAELSFAVIQVTSDFVALNKPEGIPCHPLNAGESNTLANALVAHHPECSTASPDWREAGFVHRLDIGTSGVLVAARTRAVYARLRAAFSEHHVEKTYWALVHGVLARAQTIDLPLQEFPGDPSRMQISDGRRGRAEHHAETHVRPLASTKQFTWVEATTSFGRRHQIRVHLASIGHPLVGDTLYQAPPEPTQDHAFLHARSLKLPSQSDALVAPLSPARIDLLRSIGVMK